MVSRGSKSLTFRTPLRSFAAGRTRIPANETTHIVLRASVYAGIFITTVAYASLSGASNVSPKDQKHTRQPTAPSKCDPVLELNCLGPDFERFAQPLVSPLKAIEGQLVKGQEISQENWSATNSVLARLTNEVAKLREKVDGSKLTSSGSGELWSGFIGALLGAAIGAAGTYLGAVRGARLAAKFAQDQHSQNAQNELALNFRNQYTNLIDERRPAETIFSDQLSKHPSRMDIITKFRELGDWYDFLALAFNRELANPQWLKDFDLIPTAIKFRTQALELEKSTESLGTILGERVDQQWPNLTKLDPTAK